MKCINQTLLWLDKIDTRPFKIKFDNEIPQKCWTLYKERDKNNPPSLPFNAKHLENAFLESAIHDWYVKGGYFYYHSRISEGNCWMLLEYDISICPECGNEKFYARRTKEDIAVIEGVKISDCSSDYPGPEIIDIQETVYHDGPYECTQCGWTDIYLPYKKDENI